MVTIERVQTGVRIERGILKTSKGLAEALDMPLGELLEGVLLHVFEGKKVPFSADTIQKIASLKSVYDVSLTSRDAHHLVEDGAVDELDEFYEGRIQTPGFAHRDHLRMAFLAVSRDPFPVAFGRYSDGIRRFAAVAGKPEKFHQTITGMFLVLVAERLAAQGAENFEAFIDANPDLLDSGLVRQYYSDETLSSPRARSTYVPPIRGKLDDMSTGE
ncbi:hypothetical protein Back2_03060 [Nocardioides baekrokdamisoli]|uniref:HTH cro/C1-type domain-containing protein n=1 Tax=Nocardioides baekrokdamisoli TaxID=1804624 RepID=A0A3G9IZ82_9ACTN|nr:hypothetical protein [Nocardioides baekrokdamisoli]BBH16019.1 hypothetical protein Back2_03060 [Nocardioides baekrokdamisoli]